MNDEDAVLHMISEGAPDHTEPDPKPLTVTSVRGRYPTRPRAFKQEDIEVSVTQLEPGTLVVRLDSRTDAEFWLQITVKI